MTVTQTFLTADDLPTLRKLVRLFTHQKWAANSLWMRYLAKTVATTMQRFVAQIEAEQ